MKNLCAVLSACIHGAGLAACDSPALVAPDTPRFDSGPFTVGSGNRAAGDRTGSTTADAGTERGGPFIGSGN